MEKQVWDPCCEVAINGSCSWLFIHSLYCTDQSEWGGWIAMNNDLFMDRISLWPCICWCLAKYWLVFGRNGGWNRYKWIVFMALHVFLQQLEIWNAMNNDLFMGMISYLFIPISLTSWIRPVFLFIAGFCILAGAKFVPCPRLLRGITLLDW
jgi:hypothetical protein